VKKRIALIILFAAVFLLSLVIIQNIKGVYLDRRVEAKDKPKGQYISINHDDVDIDIHYRTEGEGQAIVLIHGFMGSMDSFENIVLELSKTSRVYLVDNIGFGRSYDGLDLNYSKQSMAQVILKFIEKMGIDKPILLGHSMGGEIAIRAALQNPQAVEGLILVSPAGLQQRKELSFVLKNFPNISSYFARKVVQTPFVLKRSLGVMFYDQEKVETQRFEDYAYWARRVNPRVVFKMTEDMDQESVEDKLQQIKVNTLIIGSTHDNLIPLEQFERMNSKISNSRLVIIENTGHLPFEEKPEEVIRELKRYLNKD
jgi:pimeloyl-ACP methyl ester carboxylesterase